MKKKKSGRHAHHLPGPKDLSKKKGAKKGDLEKLRQSLCSHHPIAISKETQKLLKKLDRFEKRSRNVPPFMVSRR